MFSIHHSQLGLLYLLLSFILHPNICQERPQLSKAHMLPPLHPGLWFVCFLPSLCQGSTTTCWSPLLRLSSFCGLDTLFSTASLLNFFSLSFCCLLQYMCPDCLQKLAGSLFVMQDFSSSPLLTSRLALTSWRSAVQKLLSSHSVSPPSDDQLCF